MKAQIHLGIVEDHTIVRSGLVSMLSEYEGIKIIFDVSNGEELLDKLKTTQPDIILLDIEMPVMTGKTALEKVKRKYPKLKVIIITAFSEDAHIIEFIKKGVNSFLPKDCKIDELTEAIYTVHEKGRFFNQHVSAVIAQELAEPTTTEELEEEGLSKQEIEIIRLICENKTSKEIANHLSLTLKAIEFHRSKILRKTNSKNVRGTGDVRSSK
jgi:DNA-binding NarL/FixJ family response regulator